MFHGTEAAKITSGTSIEEWKAKFIEALWRETEEQKISAKEKTTAVNIAKNISVRVAVYQAVRLKILDRRLRNA